MKSEKFVADKNVSWWYFPKPIGIKLQRDTELEFN